MIKNTKNLSKDIYFEDLIILESRTEKAKEIAIKLLNNLNFKFISEINDLPIEEILELTKNNPST
jgi:hypothetical protein